MDKNPTPDQPAKVRPEPRENRVVVLTPDQQREIERTIVELEKASRRIDEARRFIRRSR
jgi:hypothetical protein